ncbi:hypothetical protein ANN_19747 [Periplaneta americana]|uniref:Uncharacterized protein n=1 Tax=Periplaneta americana TaxID=6978 RepID=A0ABQ8SBT1_PERAM|nr:hypothetical protein ANN_19747 [Periplaneta americana]
MSAIHARAQQCIEAEGGTFENVRNHRPRHVEYSDRDRALAGLCEGGNETSGSLKAICKKLFNVDGIGDSEMVFAEMRPRICHKLPDIRLMLGKTQPGSTSENGMMMGHGKSKKSMKIVPQPPGSSEVAQNISGIEVCSPLIRSFQWIYYDVTIRSEVSGTNSYDEPDNSADRGRKEMELESIRFTVEKTLTGAEVMDVTGYKFLTSYNLLTISCHNPGDLRNYAVKLTVFLKFGKDAATLPPRGFDGHLSILLNEGCDWLLTREDKIPVTCYGLTLDVADIVSSLPVVSASLCFRERSVHDVRAGSRRRHRSRFTSHLIYVRGRTIVGECYLCSCHYRNLIKYRVYITIGYR